MSMLSLEEAQKRLLDGVEPLGSETLPVEAALGRYLAEPLVARRTQPAADLSAMDGYAMRDGDLAGPWRVVGESRAGHPYEGPLAAGEAVRISTGALMPADAGAVLLQENAVRADETLSLNGEGDPTPRHIRRRGFDFTDGDTLLAKGRHVGPAQIGLAIASGNASLAVGRLPRVAILDSGDELAADPAECPTHRIPASNGAMLSAMCARHAASVTRIGPVADDLDALIAGFEGTGDAEVVVTSGGASVGDHDLVRPALEAWGAEIDFWRVAMRPGKPLLVARKGARWIVGLPGNPASACVTAFLFVLPLLRALSGSDSPLPRALSLPLAGELPKGGPRTEFRRACIVDGAVESLDERDSSAQRSLALANALIERPVACPASGSGEPVRTYWLGNGGNA